MRARCESGHAVLWVALALALAATLALLAPTTEPVPTLDHIREGL